MIYGKAEPTLSVGVTNAWILIFRIGYDFVTVYTDWILSIFHRFQSKNTEWQIQTSFKWTDDIGLLHPTPTTLPDHIGISQFDSLNTSDTYMRQ